MHQHQAKQKQSFNKHHHREALMMKKFQKFNNYYIGEKIGQGGFSSVHKAYCIVTREIFAVKIISIKSVTSTQMSQLASQIKVSRVISHPNIIKIYETYQDKENVYVFMEYAQGRQLFDLVLEQGRLKQRRAAKIFIQLLKAIKYLHDKGVVHRDIKAENIMIDTQDRVKLIDFGLSKICASGKDAYLSTFCGSPPYFSPEMIKRRGYNGKCVDLWCAGVILYLMLQGKMPFGEEKDEYLNYLILNNFWSSCRYSSNEGIQVYRCIFIEQQRRISIDQLLKSGFVKKYMRKEKGEINIIGSLDLKKYWNEQLKNRTLDKIEYMKTVQTPKIQLNQNRSIVFVKTPKSKKNKIKLRLMPQSKYYYSNNSIDSHKYTNPHRNPDRIINSYRITNRHQISVETDRQKEDYCKIDKQEMKCGYNQGYLTSKRYAQGQQPQQNDMNNLKKKLITLHSLQKPRQMIKGKDMEHRLRNLKAMSNRNRNLLKQHRIDAQM